MSYSEVERLPVAYRKWFIKRLIKEFDKRNEAMAGNTGSDVNHENMDKLKQYEDMLSKKS